MKGDKSSYGFVYVRRVPFFLKFNGLTSIQWLWIVLHVEQRESERERGAINVEEDERRKQLMAFVFAINAPIALLLLPSLSFMALF